MEVCRQRLASRSPTILCLEISAFLLAASNVAPYILSAAILRPCPVYPAIGPSYRTCQTSLTVVGLNGAVYDDRLAIYHRIIVRVLRAEGHCLRLSQRRVRPFLRQANGTLARSDFLMPTISAAVRWIMVFWFTKLLRAILVYLSCASTSLPCLTPRTLIS